MLEALNLKNNAETRYRCQVSVYRTIGPLVVRYRDNVTIMYCLVKSALGNVFLAHLSRRLIGELLVYRGIRRPSSTFSNDFFSEAAGPILLIFHI